MGTAGQGVQGGNKSVTSIFWKTNVKDILFKVQTMWLGWERHAKGDHLFPVPMMGASPPSRCRRELRQSRRYACPLSSVLTCGTGEADQVTSVLQMTKPHLAELRKHVLVHQQRVVKHRTQIQFCLSQGCHEQQRRVCTAQLRRCRTYHRQCRWRPRCVACSISPTEHPTSQSF